MNGSHREIVIYTIDTENRISSLEAGWENAALIGGAETLLKEESVIGHSVNEFIPDKATQLYYESLFNSCRLENKVLFNQYRCDSSSHERYMRMKLTPHKDGSITLEHETLKRLPFAHNVNIQNAVSNNSSSSEDEIKRCSICNKVHYAKTPHWIEPNTLVSEKDITLNVTYTVCSVCKEKIDVKLHEKKSNNQNILADASYYAKAMLGIILFFSIVLYVIFTSEYILQKESQKEVSMLTLNNIDAHIQSEFSHRVSDVLHLSNTKDLPILLEEKDVRNSKKDISDRLLQFMYYKPMYEQLRLIDMQGVEKLRISNTNTHPAFITPNHLQNKENSSYVQEALKLSKHEVYVSKIDLNMEHQKTNLPYIPTMRILTTIYDASQQVKGFLILNLNFEKFFNDILALNTSSMNQTYLANDKGHWLFAPNKEDSWLFMYHDIKNQVQSFSPQLWTAMQNNPSGYAEDINSLKNYKMINFTQEIHNSNMQHNKETLTKKSLLHLWLIHDISNADVKEKVWENVYKGLPYMIFGTFLLAVMSMYLITIYRRMKDTNESLKIIETSFENSDDGLLITDQNMTILRVNSKFETITGYKTVELIGNTPNILSSGWTDENIYKNMLKSLEKYLYWEGEILDRRKDGTIYQESLRIIALTNEHNKTTHYLGIIRDITENKQAQERIQKLAFKDTLTELPNRQLLLDRVGHAIENSKRYQYSTALIFIDLDDFKIINDSAGHMTGDRVLIEVANRLQTRLRHSDTLARIGGDEFVVLLEKVDQTIVLHTMERLLQSLSDSIMIDEQKYFISASIGTASYPQDGKDVATLFSNADTAMYTAKNAGKNRYSFFVAQMNEEVTRKHKIIQNLQSAIEKGSFTLVFQPQVSLEDNTVIGAEALIRWTDEELGFVSPAEFIPVAESSGLIVPITMWVIKTACLAIKTIRNQESEFKIAINISSLQIKEKKFVEIIHQTVIDSDISPRQIELEITEGALIDNIEDTIKKIQLLKSYGYRIAIDDFGTGYSSLSYVKQLGFEKLKIDQTFVRNLPNDENDIGLTKSIIAMGKALGMKIIAEGAETKESVAFLKENGCDMVQGYYFSQPLSLEDFLQFFAEFNDT